MRFTTRVSVILAESNDQLERYIDIDKILDDTLATEVAQGRIVLAASVTDQAFGFNGITNARWVVVAVSAGVVHVKLNGIGSPAIALTPLPAVSATPISEYQRTAQPGLLVIGPIPASTPITSIHLTNPSSTVTATAFVAVVGEAQ